MGVGEVLILLLAAGVFVALPVWAVRSAFGAKGRYREEGALAADEAELGRPLELKLPEGGALDLMLRYTVASPGRHLDRNFGFAALVEVTREPAPGAVGMRDNAAPHAQRFERVVGRATTLGLAPVAEGEATYDVVTYAGERSGTKVLARVPAGGVGVARVTVDHAVGAVHRLVVFVKPAR
jgi:hypothetical protein